MCAAAAHGKLQDWKDFPKGLHILVAISDTNDCNEITDTLQSCDYAVTAFTRGEDALAAIQSPHTTFHAAMVDATSGNGFDGFKILEAVHELPVIMISSTEDIGSMMRAITLGAADFLQKPFSEEKLRNIWQHVARKAMLENEPAEPPSAACEQEQCPAETFDDKRNMESQIQSFDGLDCTMGGESFGLSDSHVEQSGATAVKVEMPGNDELLQGKLEDLEEEFMNTNLEFCNPCSIKLELDESLDDINLGDGIVLDGDGGSDFDLDPSIFVGFPDSDSDSALDFNFDHLETTPDSEMDIEEAKMLAQVLKAEDTTCNISESSESMSITSTKDKGDEETKPERTVKSSKCAQGRKKTKVDWTPELHQKFVQAVEQLGVDKAIPSRILELMGVKCLTRHNIASHLQKYRSHRKHLLLREAEAAANWNHRRHSDSSVWAKTKRDGASWPTPIQPRHPPILPAPPSGVPLVVWGHPTIDPSSAHMWQQPPISPPAAWQAPDGTVWQHPAAYLPPWAHAPAPVYPHSCMRVPVYGVPQQPVPPAGPGDGLNAPSCHPPREVVDAVISEGLTNPCTLPLGLKPPSMESVMSELVRQGINITPPTPS